MPTQEGGLKGIYYAMSDKAWAFAEWLEAKGLPVATFCENHHINPLLLLAVVFLGILLLVMLALGAFGGVSYGELTVTVTSNNVPLSGATVYYEFNGKTVSNLTASSGKVTIKYPIGPEVTLNAKKEGYGTASAKKMLDSEKGTASISLSRKSGTLVVNVDVAGGRELPSGTYVVIEATKEVADMANSVGKIPDTKPIINGQSKFENLPAGTTVRAYVSLGTQKIPAEGQQATIQEGKTTEIMIEVPESSLTTSLEIRVKDSSYQNVDGAAVQLFNWDTGLAVGQQQMTYQGSATISGIVLGTSVYATVSPASGAYGSYNGKANGDKIDVSREGLPPYEITLPIVGKVEVCVYDEDGLPMNEGRVTLKGTTGQTHGTADVDEECEEFSGLPEGASVYPVVTATGYKPYGTTANAKTITYSGINRFTVNMEPLAPGEAVTVYVHVAECDTGNPISGIKVKIIDADTYAILEEATTECTGSASVTIPTCGNTVAVVAGGREIYAVAFDEDFQIGKSQIIVAQEGAIMDIITCEADENNAGNLNVCVYKDGQPFDGASLELYDSDNDLLWTAVTDADEDDEDHCYTFENIPDGETVYARAINIGTSPEVSDTVDIVGGETANVSIYSGSPPVILDKGDINVCVRNAETNVSMVANVTVYDHITGQAIIAGPTAGGGCRLFEDVTAETNSGGQIIPREIYIIVNRTGYATYNGKDEEAVLDMVPNGRLNINVYLEEAFEICTQVRFSDTDEPAEDVNVVLYYNDTADVPIADVETNSNGTARFYEAMKDEYWFKLEEDYTLYDPMDVYEFEQDEVSGGECGIIQLYDLGSLCDLGLEILDNGANFSTSIEQPAKIPLRVLEGGERGDASASTGSLGSKHQVQLNSGGEANLTLRLNTAYQSFTINYESTEYSSDQEMVASLSVDEEGQYSGIIEITKNAQCTRQAAFDLNVFEEMLTVTTDDVSFDPVEDTSASFCIYVVDQDSEAVDDATVKVYVDEMDGWAQTATQAATWNDAQDCYTGRITASLVPADDGEYESGSYIFTVVAEKDGMEASAEGTATISATELCGNGEVDDGEVCDGSADDTGCDEGTTCSSDCGECEEEDCGDTLSVSAGDFTISIGSGMSSGFCVTVSDSCGTVESATVTASFSGSGGWPADTTLSASYDTSRSCYYIPVTESVAWPSTTTTLTSATVNARLGSKTVSVGATEGGRSGSATSTGTVTCGCDAERWCEATCVCDEDCYSGGATSLNLAGCLTLASQNNYYPTGSYGYNQYGTGTGYGGYGYGTGTGYTGYGTGTTGTSVGTSSTGISIGGSGGSIGLDWEKCKQLFGWGDGGATGSGVNGYVLVNDRTGVLKVDADGPNKAGDCKTLIDHLKNSIKFKYLYVAGPSGTTDYCCTSNLEAGWGTKCKRDSFDKLLESASSTGDYTIIDIVDAKNTDMKTYGLQDLVQIFKNDRNAVMYAPTSMGSKLFSQGALFAIKGNVAATPGTGAVRQADQRVWGYLEKVQFSVASTVWFGADKSGDAGGYPTGNVGTKNIILTNKRSIVDTAFSQASTPAPGTAPTAGQTPAPQITTYSGAIIDGTEKDHAGRSMNDAMFRNLHQLTNLYVYTDYESIKPGVNTVIAQVAKYMGATEGYPKFEKVDSKALSYCKDGVFKPLDTELTLLKANDNFYVVGLPTMMTGKVSGEFCKTAADTTKITSEISSAFDANNARQIGFAREKNRGYILVSGNENVLAELIIKFLEGQKPEASNAKIYPIMGAGSTYKYGILRNKCHEKQDCTLTSATNTKQEALDQEISKDINIDTSLLNVDVKKDRIIDCVCKVSAEDTRAVIVTVNAGAYQNNLQDQANFQKYITVDVMQNGKKTTYSIDNTGAVSAVSCTDVSSCKLKISGLQPVATKVRASIDIQDGTNPACGTSNSEDISEEQMKSGPTFTLQKALEIKAGAACYSPNAAAGFYTISGRVVDAKASGMAEPLSGVRVNVMYLDGTRYIPGASGAMSAAQGEFTTSQFKATYGARVKVEAVLGDNREATSDKTAVYLLSSAATSSDPWATGGGSSGSGGNVQMSGDLVVKDAYKQKFSGTVKDCSGNTANRNVQVFTLSNTRDGLFSPNDLGGAGGSISGVVTMLKMGSPSYKLVPADNAKDKVFSDAACKNEYKFDAGDTTTKLTLYTGGASGAAGQQGVATGITCEGRIESVVQNGKAITSSATPKKFALAEGQDATFKIIGVNCFDTVGAPVSGKKISIQLKRGGYSNFGQKFETTLSGSALSPDIIVPSGELAILKGQGDILITPEVLIDGQKPTIASGSWSAVTVTTSSGACQNDKIISLKWETHEGETGAFVYINDNVYVWNGAKIYVERRDMRGYRFYAAASWSPDAESRYFTWNEAVDDPDLNELRGAKIPKAAYDAAENKQDYRFCMTTGIQV